MSRVEREAAEEYPIYFDNGEQWKRGLRELRELIALLHYYELQKALKAMDDAANDAADDATLQDGLLIQVTRSLPQHCEFPARSDTISVSLTIIAVDTEPSFEQRASSPDFIRASLKCVITKLDFLRIAIYNIFPRQQDSHH